MGTGTDMDYGYGYRYEGNREIHKFDTLNGSKSEIGYRLVVWVRDMGTDTDYGYGYRYESGIWSGYGYVPRAKNGRG